MPYFFKNCSKYDIPYNKLKDTDIIKYEEFKQKNKISNMSLKQRQHININYIAMKSIHNSIIDDRIIQDYNMSNVNF
jgi:hypothetical protein